MDITTRRTNIAKWFAVAAAVSGLLFLVMLVTSATSGESEHGFAGTAGVVWTALTLVMTPVFTVLSVVSGMVQIVQRKVVIEDVGKWWAMAVTSLAVVALAIGLAS